MSQPRASRLGRSFSRWSGLLAAGCVLGCTAAPQQELAADSGVSAAKLDPDLEDALASGEARDVLVLLDVDDGASQTAPTEPWDTDAYAPLEPEQRSGVHAVADADEGARYLGTQTREALYAAKAEQLIGAFGPTQLEVQTQYRHVPMLLVRVHSGAVLQALVDHEDVARVYPNRIHEAFLSQSLNLIRQTTPGAAGKTGAGTAVAVLDTGCDFTRAAFGSCSQAGAAGCRVAYAADFAPEDNQLDANGHGTNVAAIVLGVAPATKVLALDVFNGSGASSSDILRAIDWVIQNRATYNIVAMNLSLGSGSFSAVCTNDVFASGLASARAAGIIPVVASGNGAMTQAMASPACVPAAVSVGAVYDANVGGLSFGACSDPTTTADKVTCFSNSASFLTVLAPGALITAGGLTQAGTSQAAPHVAGALAVLRAQKPNEGVDALIGRITSTGPSLTDPRNNVTKRRLDLQAALDFAAIDTTAPVGTVQIGAGAFTRSVVVTLNLSASDDSGVPSMCISNTTSCSSWTAYASSKAWTLTSGDGQKSVRVWLKDGAGNVAALPAASTQLDTAVPKDGSLSAVAGDGSITLAYADYTDTGSGIASYQVVFALSTAPATCSAGTQLYRGTERSFEHTALSNGTLYGYRVCAIDQAGNVSAGKAISARPAPEFDAPTGSVVINADAALTKSTALSLALTASDDSSVTEMCLSATQSCSAWQAFATAKTFSIPAGDGTRSVYAWFRDQWGNASAVPVSDSVVLDATAPRDGTAIATVSDGAVALSWSGFSDAGSGLSRYKVVFTSAAAPANCNSGTVLYLGEETSQSHTSLQNGTTYAYRVCAIDAAGNLSAGTVISARPLPETDAPTGTVVIHGDAAYTNALQLAVALSASDASGVTQMCVSTTPSCNTWVAFATSKTVTLTSGDGVRTVYAWFRDRWGTTTSSAATDSIGLDTVVPKDGTLSAVPSNASVALSFSGFSDAASGIAGYQVMGAVSTAPTSCSSGTQLYRGSDATFTHAQLVNGTSYGYRVCAYDKAGNLSIGKTITARPLPEFDAPAAGSVSINGGAAVAKSPTLTLTLAATDASTVSHACISATTTCSTWSSFAAKKTFTLPAGDGTRTVYAWFRDNWGNATRTPVSDTIVLDTTPPADGSLSAAAGDGDIDLTWSVASDAGSGVAEYVLVFAGTAPPANCNVGTLLYRGTEQAFSHTDLSNGQNYGYRVCAVDVAGNLSAGKALTSRPAPEFDAPSGTVEINGSAVYTNSTTVTLTLTASDASDVTDVCLSSTSSCSAWTSFAASKTFAMGAGDGTRSVYVWFRDQWGNASASPVSDSIQVDTVVPKDGVVTASAADGSVGLSWTAFSDARSGLDGYQVVFAASTPPANCNAGTQLYRGTGTSFSHTSLTNGSTYGYRICAFDKAGNLSPGKTLSARPAPEFAAPTGTVSISAGAAYTNSTNVTLTLAASDASDVTNVCLSTTLSCSSWQAFATSKTFALTSGDGTKTVYAWFRDQWGNATTTAVSDNIVLDGKPPTVGTLTATGQVGRAALSWTAASDTGSGVASYTLVFARSTAAPATCAAGTQAYSGAALAYAHEGLSAGTYSYRLCAVDRSGNVAGVTRSVVVR